MIYFPAWNFSGGWNGPAYQAGGGKVPVQLLGDFRQHTVSTALGEVEPCIKGAWTFGDVRGIFPAQLSAALEEGIEGSEHLIPGFARRTQCFPAWKAGRHRRCGSYAEKIRRVQCRASIPAVKVLVTRAASPRRPWTASKRLRR